MELDDAKQQSADVWGGGNYPELAKRLLPAALALADACAVGAGQEVLDVAAGDGNFAVTCAEEGCSVVASDLSPGMVELGRARSQAAGVDIEWVQADAENLPFDDERFECVGSVFGAMIAPHPEQIARELFRVVRPGNTVGMTAWTPESDFTRLLTIGRRYAPDGPPEHTPDLWGVEDNVRGWFDGLANSIEMERRTLEMGADSPDAFITFMEENAPPQVAAKKAMPPDIYARMREEMVTTLREWTGGDGPVTQQAEYLVIVARRPG